MFLAGLLTRPPCAARRPPLASLLLLGLASCASLPSFGPTRRAVLDAAQVQTVQVEPGATVRYALLPLTARIVAQLEADDRVPRFGPQLVAPPASDVRVGVGDVLTLTIFESQAGGLFIPGDAGSRPGNFVQLPQQQVDTAGTISVPYGGRMRAAGRTVAELQRAIEQRLANRALEPQVLVSLVERNSNQVSVLGEVATSTHFALNPGGERLLGAIARAEGPKYPAHETLVTLQRGGRIERALLSEVATRPEQNLQLRGGDTIYLSREPRYFLSFGASGQTASLGPLNRRFAFEDSRMTLAEAVARAGGLQDDRADARSVFVYRFERGTALAGMGLPVAPADAAETPTVYAVDFTDPAGFFLARRFPIRDQDIIYTSNAPTVDIAKALSLILPFAQSAAGLSTAGKGW